MLNGQHHETWHGARIGVVHLDVIVIVHVDLDGDGDLEPELTTPSWQTYLRRRS